MQEALRAPDFGEKGFSVREQWKMSLGGGLGSDYGHAEESCKEFNRLTYSIKSNVS